MKRPPLLTRSFTLFLTFSLCLPSPAFALRPGALQENAAGVEELKNALSPVASGAEELSLEEALSVVDEFISKNGRTGKITLSRESVPQKADDTFSLEERPATWVRFALAQEPPQAQAFRLTNAPVLAFLGEIAIQGVVFVYLPTAAGVEEKRVQIPELTTKLQEIGLGVGSAEIDRVLSLKGIKTQEEALEWFLAREKTLKQLAYRAQVPVAHVLHVYLNQKENQSKTEEALSRDLSAIRDLREGSALAHHFTEADLLWILRKRGSIQGVSNYLQSNRSSIWELVEEFDLRPDQVFWMVRQAGGNYETARSRLARVIERIEYKEYLGDYSLTKSNRVIFLAFQVNGSLERAERWIEESSLAVRTLASQLKLEADSEEVWELYWNAEQTALRLKADGIALSKEDLLFFLVRNGSLDAAVKEITRLRNSILQTAAEYEVPEWAVWWAYRVQESLNGKKTARPWDRVSLSETLDEAIDQAKQILSEHNKKTRASTERLSFTDALWLVVKSQPEAKQHPDVKKTAGFWSGLVRYLGKLFKPSRSSGPTPASVSLQWRRRSSSFKEIQRRAQSEYPFVSQLAQRRGVTVRQVLWAHEKGTGGLPWSLRDAEEQKRTAAELDKQIRLAKTLARQYQTTWQTALQSLMEHRTRQEAEGALRRPVQAQARRLTAAGTEEVRWGESVQQLIPQNDLDFIAQGLGLAAQGQPPSRTLALTALLVPGEAVRADIEYVPPSSIPADLPVRIGREGPDLVAYVKRAEWVRGTADALQPYSSGTDPGASSLFRAVRTLSARVTSGNGRRIEDEGGADSDVIVLARVNAPAVPAVLSATPVSSPAPIAAPAPRLRQVIPALQQRLSQIGEGKAPLFYDRGEDSEPVQIGELNAAQIGTGYQHGTLIWNRGRQREFEFRTVPGDPAAGLLVESIKELSENVDAPPERSVFSLFTSDGAFVEEYSAEDLLRMMLEGRRLQWGLRRSSAARQAFDELPPVGQAVSTPAPAPVSVDSDYQAGVQAELGILRASKRQFVMVTLTGGGTTEVFRQEVIDGLTNGTIILEGPGQYRLSPPSQAGTEEEAGKRIKSLRQKRSLFSEDSREGEHVRWNALLLRAGVRANWENRNKPGAQAPVLHGLVNLGSGRLVDIRGVPIASSKLLERPVSIPLSSDWTIPTALLGEHIVGDEYLLPDLLALAILRYNEEREEQKRDGRLRLDAVPFQELMGVRGAFTRPIREGLPEAGVLEPVPVQGVRIPVEAFARVKTFPIVLGSGRAVVNLNYQKEAKAVFVENSVALTPPSPAGEIVAVGVGTQPKLNRLRIPRFLEKELDFNVPFDVNGEGVSQAHARLYQDGEGNIVIEDLNSLGGTSMSLNTLLRMSFPDAASFVTSPKPGPSSGDPEVLRTPDGTYEILRDQFPSAALQRVILDLIQTGAVQEVRITNPRSPGLAAGMTLVELSSAVSEAAPRNQWEALVRLVENNQPVKRIRFERQREREGRGWVYALTGGYYGYRDVLQVSLLATAGAEEGARLADWNLETAEKTAIQNPAGRVEQFAALPAGEILRVPAAAFQEGVGRGRTPGMPVSLYPDQKIFVMLIHSGGVFSVQEMGPSRLRAEITPGNSAEEAGVGVGRSSDSGLPRTLQLPGVSLKVARTHLALWIDRRSGELVIENRSSLNPAWFPVGTLQVLQRAARIEAAQQRIAAMLFERGLVKRQAVEALRQELLGPVGPEQKGLSFYAGLFQGALWDEWKNLRRLYPNDLPQDPLESFSEGILDRVAAGAEEVRWGTSVKELVPALDLDFIREALKNAAASGRPVDPGLTLSRIRVPGEEDLGLEPTLVLESAVPVVIARTPPAWPGKPQIIAYLDRLAFSKMIGALSGKGGVDLQAVRRTSAAVTSGNAAEIGVKQVIVLARIDLPEVPSVSPDIAALATKLAPVPVAQPIDEEASVVEQAIRDLKKMKPAVVELLTSGGEVQEIYRWQTVVERLEKGTIVIGPDGGYQEPPEDSATAGAEELPAKVKEAARRMAALWPPETTFDVMATAYEGPRAKAFNEFLAAVRAAEPDGERQIDLLTSAARYVLTSPSNHPNHHPFATAGTEELESDWIDIRNRLLREATEQGFTLESIQEALKYLSRPVPRGGLGGAIQWLLPAYDLIKSVLGEEQIRNQSLLEWLLGPEGLRIDVQLENQKSYEAKAAEILRGFDQFEKSHPADGLEVFQNEELEKQAELLQYYRSNLGLILTQETRPPQRAEISKLLGRIEVFLPKIGQQELRNSGKQFSFELGRLIVAVIKSISGEGQWRQAVRSLSENEFYSISPSMARLYLSERMSRFVKSGEVARLLLEDYQKGEDPKNRSAEYWTAYQQLTTPAVRKELEWLARRIGIGDQVWVPVEGDLTLFKVSSIAEGMVHLRSALGPELIRPRRKLEAPDSGVRFVDEAVSPPTAGTEELPAAVREAALRLAEAWPPQATIDEIVTAVSDPRSPLFDQLIDAIRAAEPDEGRRNPLIGRAFLYAQSAVLNRRPAGPSAGAEEISEVGRRLLPPEVQELARRFLRDFAGERITDGMVIFEIPTGTTLGQGATAITLAGSLEVRTRLITLGERAVRVVYLSTQSANSVNYSLKDKRTLSAGLTDPERERIEAFEQLIFRNSRPGATQNPFLEQLVLFSQGLSSVPAGGVMDDVVRARDLSRPDALAGLVTKFDPDGDGKQAVRIPAGGFLVPERVLKSGRLPYALSIWVDTAGPGQIDPDVIKKENGVQLIFGFDANGIFVLDARDKNEGGRGLLQFDGDGEFTVARLPDGETPINPRGRLLYQLPEGAVMSANRELTLRYVEGRGLLVIPSVNQLRDGRSFISLDGLTALQTAATPGTAFLSNQPAGQEIAALFRLHLIPELERLAGALEGDDRGESRQLVSDALGRRGEYAAERNSLTRVSASSLLPRIRGLVAQLEKRHEDLEFEFRDRLAEVNGAIQAMEPEVGAEAELEGSVKEVNQAIRQFALAERGADYGRLDRLLGRLEAALAEANRRNREILSLKRQAASPNPRPNVSPNLGVIGQAAEEAGKEFLSGRRRITSPELVFYATVDSSGFLRSLSLENTAPPGTRETDTRLEIRGMVTQEGLVRLDLLGIDRLPADLAVAMIMHNERLQVAGRLRNSLGSYEGPLRADVRTVLRSLFQSQTVQFVSVHNLDNGQTTFAPDLAELTGLVGNQPVYLGRLGPVLEVFTGAPRGVVHWLRGLGETESIEWEPGHLDVLISQAEGHNPRSAQNQVRPNVTGVPTQLQLTKIDNTGIQRARALDGTPPPALPPDFTPSAGFKIYYEGGVVTEELLDALAARLGGEGVVTLERIDSRLPVEQQVERYLNPLRAQAQERQAGEPVPPKALFLVSGTTAENLDAALREVDPFTVPAVIVGVQREALAMIRNGEVNRVLSYLVDLLNNAQHLVIERLEAAFTVQGQASATYLLHSA